MRRHGPTALILSRQSLPILHRKELASAQGLQQGGYILWEASASPDIILISTGSEVHIALDSGKLLLQKGIKARVVSLPSWELFDMQPESYREHILPSNIRARISIEAGTPLGWERYVGLEGKAIGLSHFGSSAPGKVLYEKFGLTAQRLLNDAVHLLERR